MNKNKAGYIILVFIILILAFAIARFFSGEDDWICQEGQWVKHGNPSADKPNALCNK